MKYYLKKFREEISFFRAKSYQANLFRNDVISPLFIISSGRSGSTLLRKLLMENTYVHIPPESDDNIPQSAVFFSKNLNKSWENKVNGILSLWMNSHCFKYWDLDLFLHSETLLKQDRSKQKLPLIIDYIYKEHLRKYNPKALTWGDKTPYLTFRLKWVDLVYPKAKYIYLIRDGRDVISSSISMTNWGVQKAARRWVSSILEFEKFSKRHTTRAKIFKYEDIVLNTRQSLDQIIEFLNISKFDMPQTIREVNQLGDTVLKHHENVFRPITNHSIGKYKKVLTYDQIYTIENLIMPHLKKYSYVKKN